MNLIDLNEPPEVQTARQAKIIDALMRRARRQTDVGLSAYSAFQSAIELQEKVAAQSRDLERAATELESARYERERTRKSLVEALSSMEEGLALFSEGKLEVCNELFRHLLPDISDRVLPGLDLDTYSRLVSQSAHLVTTDGGERMLGAVLTPAEGGAPMRSAIIELTSDRWYQINVQQTSSDNIVLLLTEITSIVRRNRAERENLIDRQADYLQAVFQSSSSGMCTFSASGEIKMQNRRFREILGVPFTVVQEGASLEGLLSFLRSRALLSDTAVLQPETWRRVLSGGGRLQRRVRHGSGKVLDVQANGLPDGGFLVELKDVTLESRTTEMLEKRVSERTDELTRANARLTDQYEKKARVEEELRLAKERAEAAVSSKTRFLAAASHDLLQPINAAKLLISTLMESAGETGLKPMIERLDRAFSSAEYLLHSLLDISRLESADPSAVTPSEVSLGAIMKGVHADQAFVAAGKGVQLRVVPSSAVVRSDPVYLLRSVQNLVVNAIQYTEPGGKVLVGCRRRGGKVVLEVWDTGIGIARKDQARIFDEFTRADNVPLGSGVGLGLSIVERTCRNFGHDVGVRSKPGRGSVFHIGMDVIRSSPEQAAPPELDLAPNDLPLDGIVVVIENDEDVLYATTQKLEQWGASVHAASSTDEAVAFVRDMGMPPDIILADYQLDGGDTGTRAIAEIRALTGIAVPAILITADRSERLREQGARDDFSVMTKPVKLSRLRPLIDWKIRGQGAQAPLLLPEPTKVGGDMPG